MMGLDEIRVEAAKLSVMTMGIVISEMHEDPKMLEEFDPLVFARLFEGYINSGRIPEPVPITRK